MRKLFPVLLLLTVFLVSACGTSSQPTPTGTTTTGSTAPVVQKNVPGVTDTEIVLGAFIDQSGPTATQGIPRAKTLDGFWKYINDKGGINGRKIKWLVEDDQANPQKTVIATKKLVEQDKVFSIVSGMGGVNNLAVAEYMRQNHVPALFEYSQNSKFWNPPSPGMYTFQATSDVMAGIITRYAIETLKKQKIAVLYQNDDFGKDGLRGMQKAVEKFGGKILAEVPFNPTDSDFSSQAIKLKNSGADAIMVTGNPGQTCTVFKELRKLGDTTDWFDTYGINATKAKLVGPQYEGVYGVDNMIPDLNDTSNPAVKEFRDFMAKYVKDLPPDEYEWQAWDLGNHTVELLTRAGKDLTRESIDTAALTFKDWGAWKVTWTAKLHTGSGNLPIDQWKGGKRVPITGPISADFMITK